jgi:hypothetical protein
MNPFIEAFQTPEVVDFFKKVDKIISNTRKMVNKPLRQTLPKLKYDYIILPGNFRANSGDRLFRPIIGEYAVLNIEHSAFVYGTTPDGEGVIIEMNDKNNVCCVNISGFLNGHNSSNIRILPKPDNVQFEEMLERAEQLQYMSYDVYDCNCQIFANYCTFGLKISPAVENLKQLAIPMTFLLSTYLEFSSQTLDSKSQKSIKELVGKLNTLKTILETKYKI